MFSQGKPGDSAAMRLMDLVWSENAQATAFSWERLNHAMASALHLAICNGMEFAAGTEPSSAISDFQTLCNRYRMGRWGGEVERFYAAACITGNLSACHAFEAWKKRPPFIVDGADPGSRHDALHMSSTRQRGRAAVGFRFPWKGETVHVTSFAREGAHLVACSYHQRGPTDYTDRILHRYKITPADILADRKQRKAAVAMIAEAERTEP